MCIMDKYFKEKHIVIGNDAGETIEFFMRPIKIKELKIINRVSVLAQASGSDEFTMPLLIELLNSTLSIDAEKIPVSASRGLVNAFMEFNFPEAKTGDGETIKTTDKSIKKKLKELSFWIDFLATQNYSIADIMELTVLQFNELIKAAGDRLCPEKKIQDPEAVFRKIGIPIR